MNTNPRTIETTTMKNLHVRNMFSDQSGQVLPWVAAALLALLGMGGLTIDLGNAYVARNQLQNSTNAAALAAAGVVYNTSLSSNASTYANNYSSGANTNQNYNPRWGTITPSVSTTCLNMLMPTGTNCTGAPDNAVVVKQTISVPTYFMRLFGVNSLKVTTTATASMQGIAQPWNVAVIIDSTGSMNTKDSNCAGGVTEFQCALDGVQSLLAATNPACPPNAYCPTGSNFRVSLFTFPNITTDTVTDDINCGGKPGSSGQPTATPYTLPLTTATSYAPMKYTPTSKDSHGNLLPAWTSSYELTYGLSDADANGFLNNYYLPSDPSGLNSDSSLVKIVGHGGPSGTLGCLTYPNGIINSGIGNTYFAGVIYAAQAALTAEQKLNPGSRNAIIFLSDGQANIDSNQLPQAKQGNGIRPNPTIAETYGVPATIGASAGLYTLTGTGVYPDSKDECQQGIMAAQVATKAGTVVYGVAYGAEQGGCGTKNGGGNDTSVVPDSNPLNAAFSNPPTDLDPCTTVEDVSSTLSTFYSDYLQSGGTASTKCTDKSHTVVSLSGIFQSISASFTTPRLLPPDAK